MTDKKRIDAANMILNTAIDLHGALGVVRALEIVSNGSSDSLLNEEDLYGALHTLDMILSKSCEALEGVAGDL